MTTTFVNLRRLIKWTVIAIVWLFVALAIIVAIKLSRFYHSETQPYSPKINTILNQSRPGHRNLPLPLQQMISAHFSCPKDSPSFSVFGEHLACGLRKEHYLVDNLYLYSTSKTTLEISLHQLAATYFLNLNFSEHERNVLLSEIAYFGLDAQGFSPFSLTYFHKPLDQLTLEETATLVAFLHSPTNYRRNQEALKKRQQYLLQRYYQLRKNPNL